MMNRISVLLLFRALIFLSICCEISHGQTGEIGYSFYDEDSGGLAVVQVDPQDGQIETNRVLLDSSDCREPLKVRRSADGTTLILTNMQKKGPHLYLVDRLDQKTPQPVELLSIPDDVGIAGNLAVVTGEDDFLAVVDVARGEIHSQWDVSKTFEPPANAPEDVFITEDRQYAVVSFQKDSEKGKKKGNRLAVYQLPRMERLVDLPLERSRPDLHIRGNLKEQGPGPEVIYVSTATDTLLVTLDLYGAVGLTDWSSVRQNRSLRWKLLSTSPEGRWGTAFPDRGCPLQLGSEEYFLVCNAGEEGGAALIHLKRREVVWLGETPPGLETPVFFPALRKAYSVCSGKTKRRMRTDVEKTFHPGQSLYVFDFSSKAAVEDNSVPSQTVNAYTFQIAMASDDPPLLLLAVGSTPDYADRLLTYDPMKGQILDDQPAAGRIGRLEGK